MHAALYKSLRKRVLAFAYKEIKNESDFSEENLVLVGLQAMVDPPREEVKNAISKAKTYAWLPVDAEKYALQYDDFFPKFGVKIYNSWKRKLIS